MTVLIIILVIVGVIIIALALFFLIRHIIKKNKIKRSEEHVENKIDESTTIISTLFGGKENIIDVIKSGSRVSVVVKDISLVNKEKIDEQLSPVIYMNNKVSFVIGSLSSEFQKQLLEKIE